ncbi:MAG: aminotransferase class I/II-fold pyridoxal phosphate-dependent enzyme [Pirellulales bacterium]|nr:aminotransferase class I/II-fold pyridoxal phosphate-dependent enzyme [Pirellulales bacterium]
MIGPPVGGARTTVHLDSLPGTVSSPGNMVDLLRYRATCQPDQVAFVYLVDGEDEQIQLTYRELDEQARAIGAWLESRGLTGQRALLLYPAGLDFIAAFFGCLYAGVVAVPVYPPRRNRSLKRIQAVSDDCEAKVALTTSAVLERVEPLIDETPHLKQLQWLATCDVSTSMARQWKMPEVDGRTTAFLQYTSGSTGTPKGVVLSHGNLLHNSALIAYGFEHTRSGSGVYWLPAYHDMGLIGGILQPLYVARPNVFISPMSFLQRPYRWLRAVTRYRATTSGGPNFAFDLCVEKISPRQRAKLDLSHWQVAFNGAEPVRAETIDRFCEAFGPCGFRREAFYPCYGMAEATLIVSGGYVKDPPIIRWFETDPLTKGRAVVAQPGRESARALVGCGKILADQEIVIANPKTCAACPDRKIGEIWTRGPSVAQGYWRQPELTDEMFHAHLAGSGEGPFLRTGDLGFLDDGELFVTGRIKDLLILRGVNHYPQDIEHTVQRAHRRLRPDCGAAFTIGEGDEQKLVVVQELERHKQGHFDEIFDAVRREVSAEHQLGVEAIVLIKAGSIPKTSSGKVQRHACRTGYLEGTLDVVGQWTLGKGEEALVDVPRKPSPAPSAPETETPVPVASTPPAARSTRPESTAPPEAADVERVGQIVFEEVRRVAKERAGELTLDSVITELGMDSLERMEIVASLEERFGGRFPEHILPEMETCRQVVEAVIQYLGSRPRERAATVGEAEIPTEYYRIAEFPECVQLQQSLDMAEVMGVANPFFTVHEGLASDRTTVGGRELIHFSSFNYLGMSGDPVVTRAAQEAAAKYGTSVSASRLVSGEKDLHLELEREISQFMGTEDTICFVGGHGTNETVIGHLLGPGDLILHDALSHNSILQGSILSGARRRAFAHNDPEAAEAILKQIRGQYRRVLLVIEGVYSMDGDIPELPKFIRLRQRYKTLLMIDEAHSLGTLGKTGRGIGELYDVEPSDVDIWMSTFSKTLGSCGGYVSGVKELVRYLKYTAPGFVFSVGLSPPAAAAALAALRLMQAEPERIARLKQRSRLFLELAKQRGLNTGASKDTPVIPIILGNSLHALQLSNAMFARGVNVQPILHPAVEESAARLRYFLTTLHTEKQIRYTVDVMAEELGKICPDYMPQAVKS